MHVRDNSADRLKIYATRARGHDPGRAGYQQRVGAYFLMPPGAKAGNGWYVGTAVAWFRAGLLQVPRLTRPPWHTIAETFAANGDANKGCWI